MNAALLLDHYARIADAPDAIGRLRRFILELAVRGKLLEQGGAGGSAESLDAPYAIPNQWRWRRIGDELELLNGMAFKPTDWVPSGLPIVRIQNLNNPLAPFNFCDPAKARDRSLIDDGAFLISWSGTPGTSFGAFIWQRGAAVLNQHIFRCDFKTKNFDAAFLRLAINGRLDEMIAKAHGGVGLQHITKGKLEAMLVALPPLAEQHLIVAKVDELMALCDQLEAARVSREAARDTLTQSTLAKLNTPDPKTFGDDARFALCNLAPLTTRPGQIKQLRQTILNLAVRGRLVAQDVADGSGLDYMAALPNVDQVNGRGRRTIAASKIEASEEYLDIPQHWTWARIHELGVTQTGTSPSSANPDLFGDFIPFVKPGDLDGATISYDAPGLSEQGVSQSRLAPAATVLMVCIGATLGKVNTTDRNVCFNQQINSVTPHVPGTSPFLALALKASGFQQLAWSKAGTGTLPIISKGKWEILPVPVPPLAEQHRIVAKVDELMALCDQLEASITTGEQTRSHLLESVLHHALEPA